MSLATSLRTLSHGTQHPNILFHIPAPRLLMHPDSYRTREHPSLPNKSCGDRKPTESTNDQPPPDGSDGDRRPSNRSVGSDPLEFGSPTYVGPHDVDDDDALRDLQQGGCDIRIRNMCVYCKYMSFSIPKRAKSGHQPFINTRNVLVHNVKCLIDARLFTRPSVRTEIPHINDWLDNDFRKIYGIGPLRALRNKNNPVVSSLFRIETSIQTGD